MVIESILNFNFKKINAIVFIEFTVLIKSFLS